MVAKSKSKTTDDTAPQLSDPVISEKELGDVMISALDKLYHRMRGAETYSNRLSQADTKVEEMVGNINSDIRWTYRMMTWLYLVSYVVGILIFITGLLVILILKSAEFYPLGYSCIAGGLIIFVFTLTRNPMKNARHFVTNSAKLSFAYSSYMRQIHQVDTAFRQLLGNENEISTERLEGLFKMTQDAVDEVMRTVTQMLNELDE